ncbi:hypothetical protein [Pseudoalteromonas umbrosa]|uniref:hypothetical protein n=1 Tax=Pseudoalteromonas umbrosa TaxID=3048489 RepID=UPI0024C36485|nr:hypothetical protein [Pseudoalteromonas sp. B95]MDK1289780.1 hypothetical protein [Pseudoalteromonas sp. B95]
MNLREQVKKAAALKTKTVKLPNGDVEVSEMDAKGRIVTKELITEICKRQEDSTISQGHYTFYQAMVVSLGLRENGELVYDHKNKEDIDELVNLGGDSLITLQEAILELSGFSAEKK